MRAKEGGREGREGKKMKRKEQGKKAVNKGVGGGGEEKRKSQEI